MPAVRKSYLAPRLDNGVTSQRISLHQRVFETTYMIPFYDLFISFIIRNT